jgi:hypothetical protein
MTTPDPRPLSAEEEVAIADILPARARKYPAWTWDDEEANLRTRMCLCCGCPGHYQSVIDAAVAEGRVDLAILLDGRYVADGHHRVVAARKAGISGVPVETKDAAQSRWVRDHGYVDWEHRRFGDA